MSSLFGIGANGAANFYNGVVTTSLRLDKASSTYLYRTPSSATNRRTFTISFWYKTSIVFASEASDQNNPIFYADEPSGGGLFALNVSGQGQGAASDVVNEMQYYDYDSGDTTDYGLETNSAFADPAAWYHLVWAFDTTQATEANRVKVYINGVQRAYTDMNAHHGAVVQNRELNVNQSTPHWIGRNVDTTSRYMNGYLADFNFIDGTQYAASNFGEFKNGIWIPKEPSVTYGTNGFRLQFKNTGVGTASSSTIGADTSGNNNHFTSSGIAASDCAMPDSPENNFCTMTDITFPLAAKGTIAEGALKLPGTDHQVQTSTFAIPASGKWYWEVNNITSDGSNHLAQYMGVMSSDIFHAEQDVSSYSGGNYIGEYIRRLAGVSWIAGNDNYYSNFNTTTISNGANSSGWGNQANSEGILSLALDVDAGTLKYYWNNSLIRTDSTLTANIEYFVHTNLTNSGGNFWSFATFNFGQDSSFAGTKTAQGNTDANGIGDFYYSPPSGHLALCTSNLPEATIGPNSVTQADDHFNTVIYNGSNSSQTITTGLQPDWIWIKCRSLSGYHNLTDTSRGITREMHANAVDAETNVGRIASSNTTGFTFPDTEYGYTNESGQTFVSWNWHANGGSTTSFSESGNNPAGTHQANTTAGFSIVTYTGTGADGTVSHGLGAVPAWYFVKNRDVNSHNWILWHRAFATNGFISLNLNQDVKSGSARFTSNAPTSSVFYVGSDGSTNADGEAFIAYVFAEVEGYSKFGSYIGNGNADGAFVFTGFRPAWIMFKNTAGSFDWQMFDTARETSNPINNDLHANQASAEGENNPTDFLSNGFKLRGTENNTNQNGSLYIYMAFAEAPFKYANAR